jgi:hypothetical protein
MRTRRAGLHLNSRRQRSAGPATQSSKHEQHAEDSQKYLFNPAAFAAERLGFAPDPIQTEILNTNARRVILNCTRQFGKSTVVAAKAVHLAYTRPGSLVLIASPSQRQSGEFILKAKEFLRRLNIPCRGDGSNRVSVMLPNRSRLVGIVDVEDTTRGFSAVSMLIFDEAALVSDELYRAMRPTLATSNGPVWLMSTPHGKRGFFYREWTNGEDWRQFSVKATDCPRISAAYLEQEQRDLGPDFFEQEYMCHFFAPLDAIFDEPTVRRAVVAGPGPIFLPETYDFAPEHTFHMLKREFLIGLDLGQRRDHSAIVVIEVAEIASKDRSPVTFAPTVTKRCTVRHIEQIPLRTPFPAVVERTARIADKLAKDAPTSLIVDATGLGAPVIEMFRIPTARWRLAPVIIGSGYRDNFVDGLWRVSKQDLIGRLQLAFDFNHFTIEPGLHKTEALVEELTSLRGFQRKQGRIIEAPGRKHDDMALALCLAWWGVETRRPGILGVDKRLI